MMYDFKEQNSGAAHSGVDSNSAYDTYFEMELYRLGYCRSEFPHPLAWRKTFAAVERHKGFDERCVTIEGPI